MHGAIYVYRSCHELRAALDATRFEGNSVISMRAKRKYIQNYPFGRLSFGAILFKLFGIVWCLPFVASPMFAHSILTTMCQRQAIACNYYCFEIKIKVNVIDLKVRLFHLLLLRIVYKLKWTARAIERGRVGGIYLENGRNFEISTNYRNRQF